MEELLNLRGVNALFFSYSGSVIRAVSRLGRDITPADFTRDLAIALVVQRGFVGGFDLRATCHRIHNASGLLGGFSMCKMKMGFDDDYDEYVQSESHDVILQNLRNLPGSLRRVKQYESRLMSVRSKPVLSRIIWKMFCLALEDSDIDVDENEEVRYAPQHHPHLPGSVDRIRQLLTYRSYRQSAHLLDRDGYPIWFYTIISGTALVKEFLRAGIYVNLRCDPGDENILHRMVEHHLASAVVDYPAFHPARHPGFDDFEDVVRDLISAGADVNHMDFGDETPFDYLFYRHFRIRGIFNPINNMSEDDWQKDGDGFCMATLRKYFVGLMRVFLDGGVSIYKSNEFLKAVIANGGPAEVVHALIAAGASLGDKEEKQKRLVVVQASIKRLQKEERTLKKELTYMQD